MRHSLLVGEGLAFSTFFLSRSLWQARLLVGAQLPEEMKRGSGRYWHGRGYDRQDAIHESKTVGNSCYKAHVYTQGSMMSKN